MKWISIIPQEKKKKYSNELYKGMEEYNEKTIKNGKVLELSKEYLELKKVISIQKLNSK